MEGGKSLRQELPRIVFFILTEIFLTKQKPILPKTLHNLIFERLELRTQKYSPMPGGETQTQDSRGPVNTTLLASSPAGGEAL